MGARGGGGGGAKNQAAGWFVALLFCPSWLSSLASPMISRARMHRLRIFGFLIRYLLFGVFCAASTTATTNSCCHRRCLRHCRCGARASASLPATATAIAIAVEVVAATSRSLAVATSMVARRPGFAIYIPQYSTRTQPRYMHNCGLHFRLSPSQPRSAGCEDNESA